MSTVLSASIQLGIASGFPDYGFPAYFCHSKHVFLEKTQIVVGKLKIRVGQFLEQFFLYL